MEYLKNMLIETQKLPTWDDFQELNTKHNTTDSSAVKVTGNQSISGTKTFNASVHLGPGSHIFKDCTVAGTPSQTSNNDQYISINAGAGNTGSKLILRSADCYGTSSGGSPAAYHGGVTTLVALRDLDATRNPTGRRVELEIRPDGVLQTYNIFDVFGQGFADGMGITTSHVSNFFRYQTLNSSTGYFEDATQPDSIPRTSDTDHCRYSGIAPFSGWLYVKCVGDPTGGYGCWMEIQDGETDTRVKTSSSVSGYLRNMMFVRRGHRINIYWAGCNMNSVETYDRDGSTPLVMAFQHKLFKPRYLGSPDSYTQDTVINLDKRWNEHYDSATGDVIP